MGIQYQRYVISIFNLNPSEHGVDLMEFPSSIPISEIIESEEDDIESLDVNEHQMRRAKVKAHKLYHRYIEDESQFEINISWTERMRLKKLLSDLNILLSAKMSAIELLLLFEKSKTDMYGYMKHHMDNFENSIEFEKMKPVFASR